MEAWSTVIAEGASKVCNYGCISTVAEAAAPRSKRYSFWKGEPKS